MKKDEKQILPVNSPLFASIAPSDFQSLLQCLSARKRTYEKGAYIFFEGDILSDIGIILSGAAQVVKDDFWGNRTIIARLAAGDLFGESFASGTTKMLSISVVAAEKCEVLLVDYKKIISPCASPCGFHQTLIKNMLTILADKNVFLTEKMEYITKRTTREKLIAYLSAAAKKQGSEKIRIPFDRQELADFLSVDRSALSRELGKMKKEGLIDFNKNNFELF